jgi:hypothetical protein
MDSGQLRVPAALPWVRSQRIHWTVVGSVCVVTGVDVVQVKVKVSRDRPRWPKGFLLTFGTKKVVRLSPLRTGRLYPQEYPGTHYRSSVDPRVRGSVGSY